MTPRDDYEEVEVDVPPTEAIGQGADDAHPNLGQILAEEHVLACAILHGTAHDITVQHFTSPSNARIWTRLQTLQVRTLESLAASFGSELNEVGGWPKLLQLTDEAKYPTSAHAAHFAAALKRSHLQRELERVRMLIADRGADDPEGVLKEITAKAKKLADTSKAENPASRRVRYAAKPAEPVTRLFLNKKPICTPANLTTIISRAKTGKTTALGAAVAAIIGAHYDRHDLDTFKFSAPHTNEAVILIDTEQSPYDAWTCHQRTMLRAGEAGDPEWLHHYALVGYGAKQLRDSLTSIIATAKQAHQGIFTIILDGVADFVTSVNDEAETNEFVAWLQGLAVQHNTPIICVIHSNEGIKNGDDGRGHLGKQLTRKAESNLLLKKTGEITTITSEKQRKAPITEQDGVAFQWSDEYQRHVSCDPEDIPQKKKGGKQRLFTLENFMDILPRSASLAAPQKALYRKAEDLTGIKEATFRDLLADSYKQGAVARTDRGGIWHYYLVVPGAGS